MLLEQETQVVVSEWSKAPAVFREDALVKDLFEDWAARTPGADAVVFAGERLGFGDLNARANRLAHRLAALGCAPGTLTGIYMAADASVFSEWWVTVPLIAIIVILGLGGAYFAPRDRKLADIAQRDIDAADTSER